MNETAKFLGESYGFWVQTGAVILSALMAVLAIRHNGRMARKRTTIDVLLQENEDEALREAKFAVFNMTNGKNGSLLRFISKKNKNKP